MYTSSLQGGEMLLDAATSARADAGAVAAGVSAGVSSLALMEAAGEACARVVMERCPQGGVVVACGPGNNGGDGYVAARKLAEMGRWVRVQAWGEAKGDAAHMAARWQGEVVPLGQDWEEGTSCVVDAVFGAGLKRPLAGEVATWAEQLNRHSAKVLAVDVPSGVAGDTGMVEGEAVQATWCVALCRPRPAHVLLPGRALCGEVEVAQIGIPEEVLASLGVNTWANGPGLWQLPMPAEDVHKWQRGHVAVVRGEMAGAAQLAAHGALRVGAGVVSVVVEEPVASPKFPHALLMACCGDEQAFLAYLARRKVDVVVVGPAGGVGEAMRRRVCAVLGAGVKNVVIDADGLTSFAEEAQVLFDAIGAADGEVVLTPHEGEFARLFGFFDGGGSDKLTRARAAARQAGAVVVLKGGDTVIAALDGRAVVHHTAPRWLATAGSGDVLAGFIGGLMAQGMKAFEAACAGVWLHGEAARVVGRGLIADDLPEALVQVWRGL